MAKAIHQVVAVDGHEAWPLREKFDPNISDLGLYRELGRENDWFVITKDRRQAKRPPERQAILRSGVLAFFLAPSVEKQSMLQQTATILWQWDKFVLQRSQNANGLFILPVNKGTRFRQL